MDETIVIPSPNWFQTSVLAASQDGWLVYGGPSKSLCVLEPLVRAGTIDSNQRFRAHISHRAHMEKIVSVDICPEWPEKRHVLTGGHDGVVKEWSIESTERNSIINYLHCHEQHITQKEEVVGVCYSMQTYAVSVGSFGFICKWDLNTNVVKRYALHLKSFKPSCISCSPHKPDLVAIGTKQGVVFVISLSGVSGKLVYKVRCHDEEVTKVSWCPQYTVTINGMFKEKEHKKKSASRMERMQNGLVPSKASEKALNEREQKNNEEEEKEVIIPEDDMFDVYKDYEANEFGHKKYEPEDIYVKIKEEPKEDFLAECEKLKADILMKKNEPEASIESLVEAMDKAHVNETVDNGDTERKSALEAQESTLETQESQRTEGSSQETQRSEQETEENNEYSNLLASIGRYGGIRIWTQAGKLLASGSVLINIKKDQKDNKNKNVNWPIVHWFKPDTLLIADGKSNLLQSNPLNIDRKNKIECHVVESVHRRGLYFMSSNAPRVQTPKILADPSSDNWVVWTVGQDRNVVSYSMKEKKKIAVFASCGAFLYEIKPCEYDAGKIAISAGDGSIRIWDTHTTNELEDQLATGVVTSFWQNVQGKILTIAWHPTKENLLAFATAESRVGTLDAGGSCEKPAKTFPSYFKQGVYSICWGKAMNLYACGNGELAMFRANKMEERAFDIKVMVDGQKWNICAVAWSPYGIMVGAVNGGIALLDSDDYHVITATFVFLKMIYTIAWHPKQITSSQETSKYQNFIAVCSIDKINTIVILEFMDKGNVKSLNKVLAPLTGHTSAVLQLAWNPHRDARLLSTSQDATVRIWDVLEGECIAIFAGHSLSAQGAMWCQHPQLADKVLSTGGDACVRLWDIKDHPPANYTGVSNDPPKKRKQYRAKEEKKRDVNRELGASTPNRSENTSETNPGTQRNVATTVELKLRGSKLFILPNTARQISKRAMSSIRIILTKYIEENNEIDIQAVIKTFVPKEKRLTFLKIFGTMNELNELLDSEAQYHLDNGDLEGYLMLLFYRGKVSDMIDFASENDLLDPYILSLSPTVSFKYWKDTTRLYLAQLDRMAARGYEDRSSAYRFYGGIIFRKATALLSLHELRSCIDVLMEATLFKEAYVLCRLRHMDSIAEEVLQKWAKATSSGGSLMMATMLHLVRGDISAAAVTLGRSNQVNYLKLAAQIAKLAGHSTFASHIDERVVNKQAKAEPECEELANLPSRIELLLDKSDNDDSEYESEKEELNEEIDIAIAMALSENKLEDQNIPTVLNGASTTNGNVLVDEDVIEVSTKDEAAGPLL